MGKEAMIWIAMVICSLSVQTPMSTREKDRLQMKGLKPHLLLGLMVAFQEDRIRREKIVKMMILSEEEVHYNSPHPRQSWLLLLQALSPVHLPHRLDLGHRHRPPEQAALICLHLFPWWCQNYQSGCRLLRFSLSFLKTSISRLKLLRQQTNDPYGPLLPDSFISL